MPNGLKYLINIAADLKPDEVPFQPWAAALYKERRANLGRDDPNNTCLPSGVPEKDAVTSPFKIMQYPGEAVILYESRTIFREIFTDGRPLPKDPNPTWQGYSIGRWEGDDFVVETNGLNDKIWMDTNGHPITEAAHITERFPPPRLRPHGYSDHHRRSESLHQALDHYRESEPAGGHRSARIGVRRKQQGRTAHRGKITSLLQLDIPLGQNRSRRQLKLRDSFAQIRLRTPLLAARGDHGRLTLLHQEQR